MKKSRIHRIKSDKKNTNTLSTFSIATAAIQDPWTMAISSKENGRLTSLKKRSKGAKNIRKFVERGESRCPACHAFPVAVVC
jgi:hypothetical protein